MKGGRSAPPGLDCLACAESGPDCPVCAESGLDCLGCAVFARQRAGESATCRLGIRGGGGKPQTPTQGGPRGVGAPVIPPGGKRAPPRPNPRPCPRACIRPTSGCCIRPTPPCCIRPSSGCCVRPTSGGQWRVPGPGGGRSLPPCRGHLLGAGRVRALLLLLSSLLLSA